jgi:enterochelin esterase-like enzyme
MDRCVLATVLVLPLFFQAALTYGQTARSKNTYHSPITDTAAKYAPEVHLDRKVTFSLAAPDATKVELWLHEGAAARTPMMKGADGIWRVTVGPLEPEIYAYNFVVDGVVAIDMSNPNINPGRSGHRSYLNVSGTSVRFDERQNVPHGALHIREYVSEVVKMRRRVLVYVPPQYDSEPAMRFPVLYLRHGNGALENEWYEVGRAGDILDNLLSQRKAVPMLIVMPNGYQSMTGAGSSEEGVEVTSRELMREIIPFIEKQYRVLQSRESRAIAGLSMGATQALLTGLRHSDTFAWVAEFSSGAVADVDFDLESAVPGFLDTQATRRILRLLFLSCGTEDPRYPGHLDVVDLLKKHDVPHVWYATPGVHEWKVWRHSLAELLPRLFQQTRESRQ